MHFDRVANIGYARTLHDRFICFCAPLLYATASFTRRIIKNPSRAGGFYAAHVRLPSEALPEGGNKTM